MTKSDKVWPLTLATGALGAIAALTLAAPPAQADPEIPILPPPPPPAEESISVQAARRRPRSAAAAAGGSSAPGRAPRTCRPAPRTFRRPRKARTTSYLRDLWHAVQTQEISGRDALLLLTQRPLDPHAVPTNGLPAGPQAPLPEAAPPAPAARGCTTGTAARGCTTGTAARGCTAPAHRCRPSCTTGARCHPNSCPLRRRRRHRPQTVAASLSSSSLLVASRYS